MDSPRAASSLQGFAADLRRLRDKSGLSIRALAKVSHYSRTALSQAADGRSLPTWAVVRSYVEACGGDIDEWERRWRDLSTIVKGAPSVPVTAAPPWPAEPVRDGSDPESAGCAPGAVTVHSRKIALTGTRHIVGVIELRYSERHRAAWGRFEGFGSLDHLATHRHSVVIDVGVRRDDHIDGMHYVERYSFDYHWSSLLCTNHRTLWALAEIFFDGEPVAAGVSDRLVLA